MSVTALGNLPVAENSATSAGNNTARLSSAAKEFESEKLLGQWLKDAESTFGSVPGSEEDDACGEQMKEFAMQHMATEITARGGIGIAPMVERTLAKQEMLKVVYGGEGRESARLSAVCVNILRELELEVQEATNAIACNRLADSREPVAAGNVLCQLEAPLPAIRPTAINAASSGPCVRRISPERRNLREAMQSSRSAAILQHLCSLYRNAAQHPGRAMYRAISREA